MKEVLMLLSEAAYC